MMHLPMPKNGRSPLEQHPQSKFTSLLWCSLDQLSSEPKWVKHLGVFLLGAGFPA